MLKKFCAGVVLFFPYYTYIFPLRVFLPNWWTFPETAHSLEKVLQTRLAANKALIFFKSFQHVNPPTLFITLTFCLHM
jgi:hypothetical protein